LWNKVAFSARNQYPVRPAFLPARPGTGLIRKGSKTFPANGDRHRLAAAAASKLAAVGLSD
jgi:hypothetical protein